ncbi:MAG: carotenoid biosynthesis protein [Thermomicrobiaceae bacterium]
MNSDKGLNRTSFWIIVLIVGHIAALIFGLAGLLIAVPNPQLWADSELGVRAYSFGMRYAGGLHILFAAAAMLIISVHTIGARRTIWFFAIACSVSLTAELIGTTTGFPFGDYQYTSGLGYKILDEVPFTIPLSWFYMGLASYLLAIVLTGGGGGWKRSLGSVVLGATLLTVWDLVLDPAMAHQQLEVRFWRWDQTGLYFDMPARNFLGWILTGATFMGLSRLAWGREPELSTRIIRVSFVVYLANMIFAMVISAAVGLWWPVVFTAVLGLIPATIALVTAEGWTDGHSGRSGTSGDDTVRRVSRGVMTMGARLFLAREARLQVDGLNNVPEDGPAILLSRHYHHLLDGCALQVSLPRPMHIVAAVDWTTSGLQRRLLESACRMARWPVVVRSDSSSAEGFSRLERIKYLRTAFRESVEILEEGRLLTVFPEGFPTIDPHGTQWMDGKAFRDFDPGFVSIIRAAQRRSGRQIPVIPVGFSYTESGGRWVIDMRFGAAVFLNHYPDEGAMVASIQLQVEKLSMPVLSAVPNQRKHVSETS